MGGGGVGVRWEGGGVRVDVNEELKFLRKFKKKIFFLGGGGLGVRVDVNEEKFVKIKIFFFLFFLGGGGGRRGGGWLDGGVRVDVGSGRVWVQVRGGGGGVGWGGLGWM